MPAIPSGEPGGRRVNARAELVAKSSRYRVRRAVPDDLERWRMVYAQYAEHYGMPVDASHQDVVWQWGNDPDHSEEIWVAVDERGVIQGVAHIRPFTRPLAGSIGCYLDDLVVDKAARRTGVVDALLLSLAEIALHRGWTVVRWITADDNHRARMVYDVYATRTMWITYDMTPDPSGGFRPGFEEGASAFEIRRLDPGDFDRWRHLYAQFAEHYTVPVDTSHQELVWDWLMDREHPLQGLAVVDPEGQLQGLAHVRPFARPLLGSVGGFLDDLIVDKSARRSGAVDALLNGLRALAADEDWVVVRWITADDNYRAKKVYDYYGSRTMWVTYDMEPRELPDEMKGVLKWQS